MLIDGVFPVLDLLPFSFFLVQHLKHCEVGELGLDVDDLAVVQGELYPVWGFEPEVAYSFGAGWLHVVDEELGGALVVEVYHVLAGDLLVGVEDYLLLWVLLLVFSQIVVVFNEIPACADIHEVCV